MLFCFSGSVPESVSPDSPDCGRALQAAMWVDLLNPTPDEIRAVESAFGIQLPTRGEAQEIEVSSRLYVEDRTIFMTATVMVGADTAHPETSPVTFAYQMGHLVTLRFAEPKPVATFRRKLERTPQAFPTAQKVLVGVVDEIIDRVADILESVGSDLNLVSHTVFPDDHSYGGDYTAVMTRIGHTGERAANARESLVTIGRLLAFFAETLPNVCREPLDEHWATAVKDVSALTDHATFLSNKVNFFLDATLGRINIDQNKIIKLFSVLAVIFLPPTLVASIYGMNFAHMPELRWWVGYPFSLALMLLAAVLPYWLFKRKGWL